ncbi:MAG TPA: VWA domain-containing protein [Thermoanaerobaculia bacterium]|jgi:VWFA-related protein|nr:VWA domain-containing protein [Thermoanaerobaculia bacterium]
MRFHLPRTLLVLAAAAVVAPAAPAKQQPPPQTEPPSAVGQAAAEQGAFFESVNVDLVNVDVFVTDKAGNPIKGLKQADFQLLEDGHPVTVTNFYAVDESTKRTIPSAALPPPVPAPGASPLPAPELVPEDQRLYLVVYIDNFNIRPFNRNRVFQRLRGWLDRNITPLDKVMLVTYNRSFKERVSFTSDPLLVNGVLFDIEKETGFNEHRESDRRDVLQAIDDADNPNQVIGQVRAYAGALYNDTQFSIDAIKGLVSSLGGLPGRKAILYVSEGLPQVSAQDIFQMINEKFHESSVLMESHEYDASRRFNELAAQANANRVTFYTIDAAGLRTLSSSSAETRSAGTPGAAAFVDSQNIYNLQAPLLQLAEETGGKAIINTNDVGPQLDAVGRDLRSYYSLGYQPAHAGDGRYHRIEIKLTNKAKGVRVRHRTGYRDKPLEQRMTDTTMASLLFGELGNPLGVTLAFGQPTMREDGNAMVPIHLSIPLEKVTLVPQQENQEGRLRAFLAVMDDQGGISPVQVAPISIKIPTAHLAQAREKGWGYDVTLLMREGRQKVAVGLRDDLGGVSSYVSGGILVGGGR